MSTLENSAALTVDLRFDRPPRAAEHSYPDPRARKAKRAWARKADSGQAWAGHYHRLLCATGYYLPRVIVLGSYKDVLYVVSQLRKKSGAVYEVADQRALETALAGQRPPRFVLRRKLVSRLRHHHPLAHRQDAEESGRRLIAGGMMQLLKHDTAAGTKSTDADLARALARGAGEVLLGLQSEPAQIHERSLGAEGDRRSQEFLTEALRRARPRDHVLSEEAPDDPGRLVADRVWIIDPLDGTREFSEGRRDWAVHVALWQKGELIAGAVALPRLGMVFSGLGQDQDQDGVGQSAVHSGRRTSSGLLIAVSRTRAPSIANAVADRIGATLVPMGSAGFKACAVAGREVDAYLHDGGQYEWDSAAPVVVARAAGLHVSRLDGSAPRYNQQNPYLPDLLICRPELSGALLEAIRELTPLGKQPEGKPDE